MTYAPESLLDLRAYLQPKTGLSAGNLGIVGDTAHADRGTSYHLGRDQLTSDAYSRQTARDRAGLTNAASAMDIGNHPDLRRLSKALVAACQRDAVGTRDIREVIYSPDGTAVLRWDRERGFASKPWPMLDTPLNNTHRWHTHISWYRDSEKRDKLAVFRPLYIATPDTSTGDDVKFIQASGLLAAPSDKLLRLPIDTPLYGFDGSSVTKTASARDWPFVGLADASGSQRVILVNTDNVYDDSVTRPTLLVAKTGTLVDAPVVSEPTPETHTVTLTVDGQSVYSETLA